MLKWTGRKGSIDEKKNHSFTTGTIKDLIAILPDSFEYIKDVIH